MPYGCLLNAGALVFGGLIGALLGNRVPEKLKNVLPMIFGVIAVVLGVKLVTAAVNLSAIALAVILGTVIGEMAGFEERLNSFVFRLQKRIAGRKEHADERAVTMFASLFVLFCVSGMGIFGALTEGMTGDHSILVFKSILDFFTILIFATTSGYILMFIAIPQVILFLALFFCATLVMPVVSDVMLADFQACGGVTALCVGLKMLDVKPFRVINIIPSMVLVMPISYVWSLL